MVHRSKRSSSGSFKNGATACAVVETRPFSLARTVEDAGASWLLAAGDAVAQRAARLDRPAHLVCVFRTTRFGTHADAQMFFHEQGDEHVPVACTLGAHSACDIDDVPDACLRHVALLLWQAGEIEALDLRTPVGFGVETARARFALAMGALCLAVGSARVVVVACAAGVPLSLSAADVTRALEGATTSRRVATGTASHEVHSDVEARMERLATRYEETWVPSGRYDGRAQEREAVVVRATLAALERGVVIGRYERCDVHAVLETSEDISRVHALVLVRGDALLVVDLCSTNGTAIVGRAGAPVRELGPARRVHALAEGERVRLGLRRRLVLVVE